MDSIKVSELAYCRFQLPDLDRAERFLSDFGLLPVAHEEGRRFYRATDAHPYCYSVEQGPEHFLGWAFHAKSAADLEALAAREGKPIEPIDAPGGGHRVRLQEPNGYEVDVVFGIKMIEPIEVQRQVYNTAIQPLQRKGELYRLDRNKPTPVKRLAHVVLASPEVEATTAWFAETLGLLSSDEIFAGPDKMHIGSFMRADSGDDYVDHHTFFVVKSPVKGFQHVSFEVQDIDAVLADHHYLKSLNRYEHLWGVGRHLLGSQVYDYWLDPFGYPHEHWADTDRLNAEHATNVWDAHEGLVNQWGEEPPERFKTAVKA